MSVRSVTWALERAPVTDPVQIVLLIALADRANELGASSWPSQKWLAHRARCSDRTVRRHLAAMEAMGVIRRGNQRLVEHLEPYLRPVVWDLAMETERLEPPGTLSVPPGQNDQGAPDTVVSVPPGQLCPTNHPLLPKEKESVHQRATGKDEYTSEFEEFWAVYPRSSGKYAAAVAYKKALKVKNRDDLMKAATMFRDQSTSADPQFICEGVKWLNQRKWEDQESHSSSPADVNTWLRSMWQAGTAKPVEDRSGIRLPVEYQPESDTTPAKDWQVQRRRNWITDNHDAITEAIGEREK